MVYLLIFGYQTHAYTSHAWNMRVSAYGYTHCGVLVWLALQIQNYLHVQRGVKQYIFTLMYYCKITWRQRGLVFYIHSIATLCITTRTEKCSTVQYIYSMYYQQLSQDKVKSDRVSILQSIWYFTPSLSMW